MPHPARLTPYPGGMTSNSAGWTCTACRGPAERIDETVCCTDPECRVVRILPSLPERLPWEPDR